MPSPWMNSIITILHYLWPYGRNVNEMEGDNTTFSGKNVELVKIDENPLIE